MMTLLGKWFGTKAASTQAPKAPSKPAETLLSQTAAAGAAKGSLSYANDRLIALELDETRLRGAGLPYDRSTARPFAALPSGDGESWERVYLNRRTKTSSGLYCYANHDWSARAKSIEVHGVRFGIEMGGRTVWAQPKGSFLKPSWY